MACPVAERAPMSIWWHAQNSRPSSLLATSASVTAATARLCHSAYFLMARPTDGVLSSCRKKTEESPQLKNRHAEALNRSKQPFSQLSFMTFRKKKQNLKFLNAKPVLQATCGSRSGSPGNGLLLRMLSTSQLGAVRVGLGDVLELQVHIHCIN